MAVRSLVGIAVLTALPAAPGLRADATCSSPYLARIEGQEECVYVWTLGAEGLGDGSDKLVTIDAKPGSPTYGKDISLSADDKTLSVDCFGDGKVRVFDVSNPHEPRQIDEKTIGRQLNLVSQSWEGRRLDFSRSLLAHWDKTGDDNEPFVRA